MEMSDLNEVEFRQAVKVAIDSAAKTDIKAFEQVFVEAEEATPEEDRLKHKWSSSMKRRI